MFKRRIALLARHSIVLLMAFGLTRASALALDFTTIDFPGASETSAGAINLQGEIVGQYHNSSGTHGFLLRQGVFTTIDVVLPGVVVTLTQAFGINPQGDIVGLYQESGGTVHGFLLRQRIFTTIDVPGSIYTQAFDISPHGDIVGAYFDGSATHGFLLRQGVFTTIDFAGAAATQARGINLQGDIAPEWAKSLRWQQSALRRSVK